MGEFSVVLDALASDRMVTGGLWLWWPLALVVLLTPVEHEYTTGQ
jgi:hypothetical protein